MEYHFFLLFILLRGGALMRFFKFSSSFFILKKENKIFSVGWFPTAVRIRLSQPQAGDWLAGAWAELGKKDGWILKRKEKFTL